MDEQLRAYYALLMRWNERFNLTSFHGSEQEFEKLHINDVRELLPFLEGVDTLLDLGTGAGIPGIILKILSPKIEVTLLDATRKKVSFCEEAIRALSLMGIRAVCGRAEQKQIREQLGTYDCVVSRATWDLDKTIEISNVYIDDTPNSRMIAMKGARWREEVDATGDRMRALSLKMDSAHEYIVDDGKKRCIVVLKRALPA